MTIRLESNIFDLVKYGSKKIEVRVNDEKRRNLKIGDHFEFLKRPEEIKSLDAVVTNLEYYNTFEELVDNYDMKDLYTEDITKEEFLALLSKFYTREEIEKYGVVAISFELREKSCGIAVFDENDNVLLVHHNKGHWGLPKGHVEKGETEEETAIREVKEETNIDAKIISGFREVITYSPKENTIKDVIFFVGNPTSYDLINQEIEVSEVKFVPFEKAKELINRENENTILDKAFEFLNNLKIQK